MVTQVFIVQIFHSVLAIPDGAVMGVYSNEADASGRVFEILNGSIPDIGHLPWESNEDLSGNTVEEWHATEEDIILLVDKYVMDVDVNY